MNWGSVLGGVFGVGSSFVPALIDLWNKKQERSHSLEIKKIDVEMAKTGQQFQSAIKNVDADMAETAALLAHDTAAIQSSQLSAIAKLSASVRPVITYSFFALFFIIKITALWQAWFVQNLPVPDALASIWDPDAAGLFAAILGFWFGSRAITKFGYGTRTVTRSVVVPAPIAPGKK